VTPDELRRLIAMGEKVSVEFNDEGRVVFYESARAKRAVAQSIGRSPVSTGKSPKEWKRHPGPGKKDR